MMTWLKTIFSKLTHIELVPVVLTVVALGSLTVASMFAATTNRNKPLIYQGRLTDENYVPVADGVYNVKFAIYDAASGGTCLWATGANESSGQTNCSSPAAVSVTVSRGLFTVQLGDDAGSITNMAPMNLDFNTSSYYLGMTVGSDSEMTPRVRIGSSPYAYNADELDGLDSSQFLRNDVAGTDTGRLSETTTPTGIAAGQGSLYVNPATNGGSASNTLLGAAVNGTQKMKVSAAGDVAIAGTLNIAGNGSNFSNNTLVGNLIWTNNGTSTLGAFAGNRPRTGYFGTSVRLGTFSLTTLTGTSFVSNTNLSVSSSSADLTVNTINSGNIVLDPVGKVGIGYFSPTSTVHVRAASGSSPLAVEANSTTSTDLFLKAYGGSNDEIDNLSTPKVIRTNDGGYIFAVETNSFGAGSYDMLVVKTDSTGAVQWAKTYGGTSSDEGGSVIQTTDGGYMIFGQTGSFGAGGKDMIAIKTDSSGNVTWSKTYGGPSDEYGFYAIQDPNGGYALFGRTFGFGAGGVPDGFVVHTSDDGVVTWAETLQNLGEDYINADRELSDGSFLVSQYGTVPSAGGYDAKLTKLSSSGSIIWQKVYGGAGLERFYDVTVGNDGSIYAVGQTSSDGAGSDDLLVVKFDSSGNLIWAKAYGGPNSDRAIAADTKSNGNILIGGHYSTDGLVMEIDPSGTIQWATTIGGSGTDNIQSIKETPDGGVLAGGVETTFGAGNSDYYIARLNSNGTFTGCTDCNSISPTVTNISLTLQSPSLSATSQTPTENDVSPTVNSPSPTVTTRSSQTILTHLTPLFVSADGNVGIATTSPSTRLDVTGLTVNTDADNTVATLKNTATFTKNDGNTRTFSINKIVPTFNLGNSDNNTTVNSLDLDTINTSTIGLTNTNLIKASYGGATKLQVASNGDMTVTGDVNPITSGGSIGSSSVRWRGVNVGNTVSLYENANSRLDMSAGNIKTLGSSFEPLQLRTGTNAGVYIDTSGKVGINTTSPTSGMALDVNGTLKVSGTTSLNTVNYTWPAADAGGTAVLVTNASGGLSWGTSSAYWVDDGTVVRLSTIGNTVGIGTSTPTTKLDVQGGVTIGTTLSRGVASENVPVSNVITTETSSGSNGQVSAITIGSDGFPVVAYTDVTNNIFKIFKCSTITCTSGTSTNIDNINTHFVGPISIAIGTDGYPVMAYTDISDIDFTRDLKVTKCGNISCSSGNTTTTVQSTNDVGYETSIAIGTDGFPVISYYDGTAGDLKMAKCGNAACSSGNTLTTVQSTNNVGRYSSIAIGVDGLPIISFADITNADLRVAKCGVADCSSGNTITSVDTTGNVGQYTSIAIGADGFAVISYYDVTNLDLKVFKCSNIACSTGTATTIDSTGSVGKHTSISIGPDTLPIVSYYDETNLDLKVAKCGNISCSSGNTTTTVDSAGSVGQYTSIAIGSDGLPIMNYYSGQLKVAHCGSKYCINNWTRH